MWIVAEVVAVVVDKPRKPVGKLTGKRKAGALLIALGPERAAPSLKSMSEDEIELLSTEIVRMQRIATEVRDSILQ